MKVIDTHDYQRLNLDDGTYLFLVERNIDISETNMSPDDYARNVWRLRDSGEEIWRIQSEWDHMGNPFVQLFMLDDPTLIDRWDGYNYKVNLETGWAELHNFHK